MLAKKAIALFCSIAIVFGLSMTVQAKQLDDGTYAIDYTVLKAGETSVSIANDYFHKPAKLIVKDNKQYVELTIGKSNWTKKLTIAGEKETAISSNEKKDERVVQFPLKSTSEKQPGTVDVYINEKVDGEDFLYDNSYEIQFEFNEKKLEKTSSDPAEVKVAGEKIEQPKKESTNIYYYIISALILFVIVLTIRKQMKGRNSS